ncbi:MAG: hypothetical protein ABH827_00805 [bacterium]
MKFCMKIYLFLGFVCLAHFAYTDNTDAQDIEMSIQDVDLPALRPVLQSHLGVGGSYESIGEGQECRMDQDLEYVCRELVRSYIFEEELTRGVKTPKKEQKDEKDIVEVKDVECLCSELGHTYLGTHVCQEAQLPAHCKRAYDVIIKAFSGQLDRDVKLNNKTVVSRSGVGKSLERLLSSFKRKYIDPIVCACNFEPKLQGAMNKICNDNKISFDGVYSKLTDVFEAKKQALSENLLVVFGRNKSQVSGNKALRDIAGDLRLGRSQMRKNASQKVVTKDFLNDFFTPNEFQAYVEIEMKEFVSFAKNISVSLWWQELSQNIDLSSKSSANSKIVFKTNKRHLLTPPACFKN